MPEQVETDPFPDINFRFVERCYRHFKKIGFKSCIYIQSELKKKILIEILVTDMSNIVTFRYKIHKIY